ncbi:polyketide cyclase/dehydrase/lipid transport protein [Pontibacter ummariensis]|uniref:Polyketide cyclase / dehydrase and lipid transport n=1 Tax=Pontibacter ummariensis TaxID=1610492 RepID=A0A239FMA4_9BACT|nr:SRPBCC family protein [Pontibacter ummariensis]PRY12011.1 polyketide cyclase/dehydrase/lipid transport protein [Pontibacter ummariensis]SNS57931.1 Polyketide cyclase / dehydrase and lipid transport [Pontibacter ummariensis]
MNQFAVLKKTKLKYLVLITLPLVLAVLLGATYLLPTVLLIEHAAVLEAEPEEVYPLLSNPMEWEKWSVRNKTEDPTMIHLYGGPMAGVGARMQWSGDKVGNGQLIFTEETSPSALTYLQTEESDTNQITGTFTLAATRGGTKIVWRQQANYGTSPLNRVKGLLLRYKRERELEAGLAGLKTLLKNNSKKSLTNSKKAYATSR